MKKNYLIIVIILIFIISLAVRYWPIFHKGFSYSVFEDNLILARNLSLTKEYKIDNEKNVILSSEKIKDEGIPSVMGNKLTPVLYGRVFDFFGFNQNIPLYFSLILYGIVSVLLFLLILRLFDFRIALLFSFFEIFSPLVLQNAIRPGVYEWAILFSSIALFIYLWKEKPNLFKLFFIGLFFGLASLARNSFLIIPFVFLVYDFWKNKSFKRIIILILPVLIFWGIYLGPGLIERGAPDNVYIVSEETTRNYMHIFPDPYTWHFEKSLYVESIIDSNAYNYDYSQFLGKFGYTISLKNKILMYWASAISYPKGILDPTTIGGPFLVFFLILGVFYLYKKKRDLLKLFILWGVFLYVFLIFNKSNHWGHFLSLQLPLFLLISMGIYWFIQLILKQDFKKIFKYIFVFGFIITLFLHLIQSDKWTFHENYLYSDVEKILSFVDVIEKKAEGLDKKKDVIAVGSYVHGPAVINYYTDFSCVYFNSNTVKRLLEENKLQWAFEQFKVTKIIGYDEELIEKIIEATNVEAI